MKNTLDEFDIKLLHFLSKDGRATATQIANELKVAAPTVRHRIQRLIDNGMLRISGLIDPAKFKDIIIAIIGITLMKQEDLDSKVEEISKLENVNWAAVVSGQYDIFVEVSVSGGIPELHKFISKKIPLLGGIRSTETFVLLSAKNKWIPPCTQGEES